MNARFFRGVLTAVVVLVVGASLASASTIVQNASIFGGGEQDTPWPPPNSDVTFAQFDLTPDLVGYYKVLDSVVITLSWHTTGQVDVLNKDTVNTRTFDNATSSVPLTLTGPFFAVNTTAVAGPVASATSTPTFTSTPPIVAGMPVPIKVGTTYGENDYTGIAGSGSQSGSPGNLAAYEGFGVATVTLTAAAGDGTYSGRELGGTGHLFFGGDATAGGDVQIVYTWHEELIPEPETLFLVGSALVGVSVMLQRKRKRARS